MPFHEASSGPLCVSSNICGMKGDRLPSLCPGGFQAGSRSPLRTVLLCSLEYKRLPLGTVQILEQAPKDLQDKDSSLEGAAS